MHARNVERYLLFLFSVLITVSLIGADKTQKSDATYKPVIPKTWDEAELAGLEVPLADSKYSPKYISAEEYYSIPVRPIYKSYPRYHPDREPPGYQGRLKQQEPVIVWDDGANRPKLVTEEDWIKAGETVFNAPVLFGLATDTPEQRRAFIAKTGDLYDKNGISPFSVYVIRERGKLEIGEVSCAECHSRVMPDGSVIAGAPSNRPIEQIAYSGLAEEAAKAKDKEAFLAEARLGQRLNYAAPWLRPDPNARLEQFSAEEIEAVHFAIPPGVFSRQGTSPFSPARIPDLIGIRGLRYLDATGLVRHRSIADLMRYAALNQGMDMLSSFGDFVPARISNLAEVPGFFAKFAEARYSDEQLYAMAMYSYSLKPPSNPNRQTTLTAEGEKIFKREGCATCHTPPLYTNNKLIPADGFTVPSEHKTKFDIMPLRIGTDPTLATTTRRGTGYYKVPSLRGLWYRSPFEHNGSVATLEDWFDPHRLRDDYVPTGWRGYGVERRAVKGHEFGLKLSAEDKRALIAFLKTL